MPAKQENEILEGARKTLTKDGRHGKTEEKSLDFNIPSTAPGHHGKQRERERETETERQRDRERERERQTDRQTERDRERERENTEYGNFIQ